MKLSKLDKYMAILGGVLLAFSVLMGIAYGGNQTRSMPKFSPTVFKEIAIEEGYGSFGILHADTWEHIEMETGSKGTIVAMGWALMKEFDTEDEIRLIIRLTKGNLESSKRMCAAKRILAELFWHTDFKKRYRQAVRRVCS